MTESEQNQFRSLIAKRKAATGTVMNAAPHPSSRATVALALQAKVDAGKAALAAAEARAQAKIAAAAVQPGLTTAKEFAGEPKRMTREEFRKLSAPDRARFVREGGKLA